MSNTGHQPRGASTHTCLQVWSCIPTPSAKALMDALVGVRATVIALFCASSPVAPSWLLQQAQEQRHQEHILEWVCWGHTELGCLTDIYCNSTYPSTHVNTSGISLAGNTSFCAMIEHNKNQQEARQTEKFFPLFFLNFTT